jgi:predicted CxxxxCH...CXXCH cytochrome family protein
VETLAAKQRLVPECLPCHSEQYRRTGKFVVGWGQADGVQCSTCHGEGMVHSLLERKDQIVRDPGEKLCLTCHEAERDSQFQYVTYQWKIKHWE